jgi:hypothetical protein
VDTLAAEFPAAPLVEIYDKVGDARATSAKYLPNVAAYGAALERHARVELELKRAGPPHPMGHGPVPGCFVAAGAERHPVGCCLHGTVQLSHRDHGEAPRPSASRWL